MLFTQIEFLVFFVVVMAAAWAARTASLRNSILLAASYYFYAYWDYRFCGLLIASTIIDFICAQGMHRSDRQSIRKVYLWISLAFNLGMLGFFKYAGFFVDSAATIFSDLGWDSRSLGIVLPVGISFFTFQTLSYTFDVYRRRLTPTSRLLDFALYVAFFPQLVAGPIVRARELLPQLQNTPVFSRRRCYGGFQQFLRGAVKKVLLADRLGEMVDVVFAGPELYSGTTLAIAVLAYAGQIYYDFSGYSDMAIGAAKMLGYRFPRNFWHPYLATSISDFWHRWHMTLSRWLKDYLYISLGGNRLGGFVTYRNLLLTMLLGGLWHGAAWTFVLWGAWHGAALVSERFLARHFRWKTNFASRFIGWFLTMSVVLIGWVLFRSGDLATAMTIVSRVATLADGIPWYPPLAIGAIAVLVAEHAAWRTRLRLAMRLPANRWYSPIVTTVMLWSLILYAPQGFKPFVYFQF